MLVLWDSILWGTGMVEISTQRLHLRNKANALEWKDVHYSIEHLIVKMKVKRFYFTNLVAIGRGGMVVSSIFSYMYGMSPDKIQYLPIDRSEGLGSYSSPNDFLINSNIDNRTTLFLDDICDSGETIKHLKHYFPKSRFAVVYVRFVDDRIRALCDIFAEQLIPFGKDRNVNFSFPWDLTSSKLFEVELENLKFIS